MTENEQIVITKYDLYYESRLTRVETALESISKDIKEIKADLKSDIKDLRYDIKWILGLMFSFATIFIGIMAKGFHWW